MQKGAENKIHNQHVYRPDYIAVNIFSFFLEMTHNKRKKNTANPRPPLYALPLLSAEVPPPQVAMCCPHACFCSRT